MYRLPSLVGPDPRPRPQRHTHNAIPLSQSTIGAFFLTKKVQLGDGSMCKIQIWDTAGQVTVESSPNHPRIINI